MNDRRRIVSILFILTIIVVLHGVIQFAYHGDRSFFIGSLLDNRNMLGAFLAIILPLFYGALIHEKRWPVILSIHIVIIAGAAINTAWASLVVLLIVFTFMSLSNRDKRRLIHLLPPACIILVALYARLDGAPLKSLVLEPNSIGAYHDIIEKNVGMIERKELIHMNVGKSRRLGTSISGVTPDYMGEPYKETVAATRKARSRDVFISGSAAQVRQRILEWQASLSLFGEHPLLGVGPGNYQENIGVHFSTFPKLNTLEPDTQNGWLVLAAVSGFLGLSTFVWLLIHFISLARKNRKQSDTDFEKGFALGLTGSLVSFSIINVFYNASSHHATTLLFIIVAALTAIRGSERTGAIQQKDSSGQWVQLKTGPNRDDEKSP